MRNDFFELDEGPDYTGYREAIELIHCSIQPLGAEDVSLESAIHRIAAEDVSALVNHPPADVALKDGYAVRASDVAEASGRSPVSLSVIGAAFAGAGFAGEVTSGRAVKVCSGAPIPVGAEAVVPVEFCEEKSATVSVRIDAEAGRNILCRADEVKEGDVIIRKGTSLLPGIMGLAAAAGVTRIRVYRRPKAALIGVGDEVVAPGRNLRPGQIYASNLVTLKAWLSSFRVNSVTSVSKDKTSSIELELQRHFSEADVILTSGGAWGSERDLVIHTLDGLDWRKIFHHVRMGPGKGIAFGVWKDKPVFCLPGGPASNEMAFLQLALPGILRMSGDFGHPLPLIPARLTENVESRHKAWTEFRDAALAGDPEGTYTVGVYRERSRLQAIAGANGFLCIPEGVELLRAGEIIPVQVLSPHGSVVYNKTEPPLGR
jgi:molybdopterin molybdotransferase